ncbi:MAG TPA: hypothetical protein VF794_05180 [Archangium sp.]|jgi:hypothetical protein|uniref:hypothetical protein n=1 Tax=Archangium sp. TaxID=1872627 RepID=UPI002ED9EBE8
MRHLHLLIPLTLILAACGPSHEGTVTYQVHLKPGNVTGSTIADDTHINPEDPQWKAFISQAQSALETTPTRFDVTDVRLQLDVTRSQNVGMLQDVLTGPVTAFLRSNDTGTQVDIAELEDPKGSAQVSMDTLNNDLEPLNANLARNDFRLGLRGTTPKTSTSSFEATITITLDVTAR